MTSRHYCVTFWTEPKCHEANKLRYAVYGREICPKTGKVHWQSYVELNSPVRASAIKKMFKDDTCHIELRKGTREEARDYCMKDKNFTEFGKWIIGQGHRSDLENVVTQLVDGKKTSELMVEQPTVYCKYRNGLKDIAATVTKNNCKQFRQVEVTLITGPTGCGKTRRAMEHTQYKIEGSNLNWWQDYDGEDSILIDEYDNDIRITELLNILDGYQLRLNQKGTHTYANWTKVFITTNLRADQLHAAAKPAHKDALFRRISHIVDLWETD